VPRMTSSPRSTSSLSPRLRRRGSGHAISGERCNAASAQFTDDAAPGDQAFLRHFAGVHGLSHLLFTAPSMSGARRRCSTRLKRAREWLDNAIALINGRHHRQGLHRVAEGAGFGFPDEMSAFGLQFGMGWVSALHERPIISRVVSLTHPTEIKEGMVFALETYCPATTAIPPRASRRSRGHRQGLPRHHPVPGGGLTDRQPVLRKPPRTMSCAGLTRAIHDEFQRAISLKIAPLAD